MELSKASQCVGVKRNSMKKVFERKKKSTRKTSKGLKVHVLEFGLIVSSRTIRGSLNQSGVYPRRLRKTPLVKTRHKKEGVDVAKEYLDKPQSFQENVLWTDETKIEVLGNTHQQSIHSWRNEPYKNKKTLLKFKHGKGSIMPQVFFSASGIEGIDHIIGTMKSEDYQWILEQNA